MNIKDIAGLCGVSPSTVSKILHDKDADISVETRKKVLEVIKEYQYVPYSKVIHSASPKTSLIGVLMGDGCGSQEVLYGIEEAAAAGGYSILLCHTAADAAKARKYKDIYENKGADGLLYVYQPEELTDSGGTPAVHLREYRSRRKESAAAQVYYELRDAGYLAAGYLLEKGHRRIACLLQEGEAEIGEGCLRAYRERYVSPEKEWFYYGTPEDIVNEGLVRCLSGDVTALVCSNAEIANRVYDKLRERGDTVPGRISIVSARDSGLAEQLSPGLTAVHVPYAETGRAAVDALIRMMESRQPARGCDQKIGMSIRERYSVQPPEERGRGGKIVVVGSMNIDCMINVGHIPTDGETVRAGSLTSLPGGKGANQAVGAGKLGGLVYMIGRLGNDGDGKEIYNSLMNSGVKTDGVVFDDSLPTGKAYINVAPDGESTIVIYPGANRKLDRGQVRRYESLLDGARYCLLTLEISGETVEYTVRKCRKKNVEVILKPAAVDNISESLFPYIDYFVPNEKEVKQLLPGTSSLEEKADILLRKGVKNVIITLGHNGCYLKNSEYEGYFPAADFQPVDTTGAADAFISALAVALSEDADLPRAVAFATYAAGASITRQGVQPAMVGRRELALYQEEINGMTISKTS